MINRKTEREILYGNSKEETNRKENIKYIEELYAEYSKGCFSLQENMLKMKILQKMLYRVHLRKC